ncbi:MAG: YggS family pyridoxal phosphate-dependent enzyme [Caldilineaceae bacterium]
MSEPIANRLQEIRQRMAAAAQRAGRDPAQVQLVAVSKTHPISAISEAIAANQADFGENRLEELAEKIAQADQLGLRAQIRWHIIGTIQSRKSGDAVALWQAAQFALIHSVDTLKLARRLSRDAASAGVVLSILLEVNVSGEESKHGFTPTELRQTIEEIAALPAIDLQGLMTMAPLEVAAEATRPVFRGLRLLRDELQASHPQLALPQLSMGMTNDFEVAIEEGATLVRVGSAIFGAR